MFQIAGLSLAETFVAVIIQIKMRVQFIDTNGVNNSTELFIMFLEHNMVESNSQGFVPKTET